MALTTRARGKAKDKDLEFKSWGFTARNFTLLSAIERKRAGTNGVLVTTIDPAGPAGSAKPALQADDCIVSVAGKPVRSAADLREITAQITKDSNRTELVVVEFERGVSRILTAVRPKPTEREPEENASKPGLSMLLQPIGPELAEAIHLKQDGARVSFVFPDGAAQKAGIRVGDILARFDGETVRCRQESDLSHFLATVRRHQIGDEVECGLLRGKQPLKLKLKLEADDPDEEDLKTFKDKELEFAVRDMTAKERVLHRIPADVKGPRVTEVKNSGWAALAHVSTGDLLLSIDGAPTPDVAAAERLLKAAAAKKPRCLVFLLRRGVHTLFAELEPTWDSPSLRNHDLYSNNRPTLQPRNHENEHASHFPRCRRGHRAIGRGRRTRCRRRAPGTGDPVPRPEIADHHQRAQQAGPGRQQPARPPGLAGRSQGSQLRRAGHRRRRPDGGLLFRLEPDGKAGCRHQDHQERGRRDLQAQDRGSRGSRCGWKTERRFPRGSS